MNILNKLTLRNLKLNKKRTLVTIIGITLSVALICAITTFVASIQSSLMEHTIKTKGNYHIQFDNLASEDSKYIINNVKVKEYMLSTDLGYSKLIDSANEYKPYLFIKAMNDEAINNMGLVLESGRFPQNDSEILLSNHIMSNGGIEYKLGETIELNLGKRISSDESELNQNNPLVTSEKDDKVIEEFVPGDNKKYTVVGIIQRPNMESFTAPGYTVITRMDDSQILKLDKLNINFLLKNSKESYKVGEEILEKLSETSKSQTAIQYNDELLRFEGITRNDSTMQVFLIMAVIVILIIVFTSIFVIKNSFNISLTERLKQYGMLSSVGATSKQIRKNVLFEGVILGCIAIPLGIIVGIVAIVITLLVVGNILNTAGNILGFEILIIISPIAILVALLISIVTIYISSLIPAIKASHISPIDAIRETNDIKIKNKKLKTSKILKRIFGIEGDIANKNLKRSKKKYRTTIFSIVISIVLFISMSTVINYGFKLTSLVYDEQEYNIAVNTSSKEYTTVEQDLDYLNKIQKLNGIERSVILKDIQLSFSTQKYASTKAQEYKKNELDMQRFTDEDEYNKYIENNYNLGYINLYAIGDVEYRAYIKELGLKYEDVKDKGILIDKSIYNANGVRTEFNTTNLKAGDSFTYKDYDKELKKTVDKGQIQIVTRADKMPMGVQNALYSYNSAVIIVSDAMMENFDYYVNNMYIKATDSAKLTKEIQEIDKTRKNNVYDLDAQIRENNAMVLVISIFFYGFIIVISIIGITNIFNTVTTNMALRNREFAVLKSIGMTNKEFKKMINFESILYGLKALVIGIPLGVIFSYLIYIVMNGVYSTQYFVIPIKEIIICVVFVFLIIFLTMRYSIQKTKKQNIIDTIRQENI